MDNRLKLEIAGITLAVLGIVFDVKGIIFPDKPVIIEKTKPVYIEKPIVVQKAMTINEVLAPVKGDEAHSLALTLMRVGETDLTYEQYINEQETCMKETLYLGCY